MQGRTLSLMDVFRAIETMEEQGIVAAKMRVTSAQYTELQTQCLHIYGKQPEQVIPLAIEIDDGGAS